MITWKQVWRPLTWLLQQLLHSQAKQRILDDTKLLFRNYCQCDFSQFWNLHFLTAAHDHLSSWSRLLLMCPNLLQQSLLAGSQLFPFMQVLLRIRVLAIFWMGVASLLLNHNPVVTLHVQLWSKNLAIVDFTALNVNRII